MLVYRLIVILLVVLNFISGTQARTLVPQVEVQLETSHRCESAEQETTPIKQGDLKFPPINYGRGFKISRMLKRAQRNLLKNGKIYDIRRINKTALKINQEIQDFFS